LHKNSGQDVSLFKFNINDKLDKIQEYLAVDEISGFITYKGKIIDSPGDYSFAKMFVHDQD
jgi:hypothetical protein